MRVPTRSAGTRSGVNWIRLKPPEMVAASVFTVSVLASPGTPSTSRCPWASVATSTRSRKWSWPTTTFFTSNRIRSIVEAMASPLGFSRFISLPSEGMDAGAGGGVLDRHREADADEGALAPRVEDRGDDADHFAVHGDQRPAGVARVGGGVELDQVAQRALAVVRAELALQPGDHAGRNRRPDAERKAHRDHLVAWLQVGGRAQRGGLQAVLRQRPCLQHGEVVLGHDLQHRRVG